LKILAISGSLRTASIHSALLRAVRQLAPADMEIDLFQGLGELPLFNPDLTTNLPVVINEFHRRVTVADALLIASPEYAHGVTGSMKNALDWLVSHEPFSNKAVVILNASPRAQHADAAIRETLKTMDACIVEAASITLPILGSGLDEHGMVHTPSVAETIQKMLSSLHAAVKLQQATKAS
jgi:chromate reductase, NAD(P)H dehydrogenase (quinone)